VANWPDAGRYALASISNACNVGSVENQLPYYGFYPLSANTPWHGGGLFTQLKSPTGVIIQIPGTVPGDNIALLYRGILVDQVWAGTSTYFYDVNDGIYMAVDCTNGQTWEIIVAGTAATVVPIAGALTTRPTTGLVFPLGLYNGGAAVGNIYNQYFITNGSFAIPTGVLQVKYKIVGPGAGGGGSVSGSTAGGGGGGGGGAGEGIIAIGTNTALAVVVGTGGIAGGVGGSASNGANGTPTSITGTGISIVANGGNGGTFSASGAPASGGTGGTVTGASFSETGGTGGQGVTYGSGLAQPGAAGGPAGSFSSVLGGTYGMGGGGGANGISGQAGTQGYVIFEWVA